MNIFALHQEPTQAALWLDDLRKNKMITESCQLMSTAINTLDPTHSLDIYSNFNPKHGSNVWTAKSELNFRWLLSYTTCLLDQRPYNINDDEHSCTSLVRETFPLWLAMNGHKFKSFDLTPFSNNSARSDIGVSYKHIPNTILAYRMYINHRWCLDYKQPTWNFGQQPSWYNPNYLWRKK